MYVGNFPIQLCIRPLKERRKSQRSKACLHNLFLSQGRMCQLILVCASDPKGWPFCCPMCCALQAGILSKDISQGKRDSSPCCLHSTHHVSALLPPAQEVTSRHRDPRNPAKSIFNPVTQNRNPEGLLNSDGLSRESKIKGLTQTSFSLETCTNLL